MNQGAVCFETVECILALHLTRAGKASSVDEAMRTLTDEDRGELAVLAHAAHIFLGKELERRAVITARAFGKHASPGASF